MEVKIKSYEVKNIIFNFKFFSFILYYLQLIILYGYN